VRQADMLSDHPHSPSVARPRSPAGLGGWFVWRLLV